MTEQRQPRQAGEDATDGALSAAITCRIDGREYTGTAIDLPDDIDAGAVVEAIRGDDAAEEVVAVACPEAGPLFEHIGYVRPEMGLRTKTALARAGRSRGMETPHDADLAAARERLAELTVAENERGAKRAAVTDHERAVGKLRQTVATARGRLQARRESDEDAAEAVNDLRAAIRELSEHETEAIAAREELDSDRNDARTRRDHHQRRFELDDRVANLERKARSALVEQLREEYTAALSALSEASTVEQIECDGEAGEDPFAAEAVPAALAIARVGSPSAPLVLCCDCFESAVAAREFLDCPVIVQSATHR